MFNLFNKKNEQPEQVETTIEQAVKTIAKELRADKNPGSYYHSWQSNIAMAINDEMEDFSASKGGRTHIYNNRLEIANAAAKRFLDLLIYNSGK